MESSGHQSREYKPAVDFPPTLRIGKRLFVPLFVVS